MRRFVIGDIHGAHKALVQCFERSGFNRDYDLLISLGDLADGWPDVEKVFDELLSVKHLITILGNHDLWLLNWFRKGEKPNIWLIQGGTATIQSFGKHPREEYKKLLEESLLYYQAENRVFVHGGILSNLPLQNQDSEIFLWDRSLIREVLIQIGKGNNTRLTSYDMIFVGHTPTINFGPPEPIISSGVCMMDTGAGWPGGKLTIMNIDSSEYFSSDAVDTLYPNISVR
jgi:serine/threonine protein phosphatase 1